MHSLSLLFLGRDTLSTISDFSGIVTGTLAIVITFWIFRSQKAMDRRRHFTKLSFELILNFIQPYYDIKRSLEIALEKRDPYEKIKDLIKFLKEHPFSSNYSYWESHKVDIYISFEQLKCNDAYNKVLAIERFIKEAKRFTNRLNEAFSNYDNLKTRGSDITVEASGAKGDGDKYSFEDLPTRAFINMIDNNIVDALQEQLSHMNTSIDNLIDRQPELCINKHLEEIQQQKTIAEYSKKYYID